MKFSPFSKKQLQAMSTSTARINVFDGPVRSGKTMSANIAWINWIQQAPDGDLLMSARTEKTLERNVLNDIFKFIGDANYSVNWQKGYFEALGRRVWFVGANDEKAEEKIRGMTIAGWYDDETTLKPQNFVNQGLARMSIEGARAFWTTNPDGPYHFLNTEFLENKPLIEAGRLKRFKFDIDDNLSLSEEYKESLKSMFSGVFYKRNILGLWVQAEGAIYDMFDEERHVVDDSQMPPFFERYVVGVDFGMHNATVFLLLGVYAGKFYVVKEYYFDSRQEGKQKTVGQYADDFKRFIDGFTINRVYVDPSAAALILEFQRAGIVGVTPADNDVKEGISAVGNAFNNDRLFIHKRCKMTLKEIASYVWDSKAQKRGEDKPMKTFDHACDALRYPVYAMIGRTNFDGPIDKPFGW